MTSIVVRHNVEMAHRLLWTPGKCQQIHGHSWDIELELFGESDPHGLLEGLDFGVVKKDFRGYLDDNFDHRLLLNEADPWAGLFGVEKQDDRLPGLVTIMAEPTTEHFAANIGLWAVQQWSLPTRIIVHETATNSAIWRSYGPTRS